MVSFQHKTIRCPYLEPFKDKLEELLSPIDIRYLQEEERIYGIPVGFLRGASWENKFILVDEAQNLSEKEMITIMTRIGENCKVFICGDSCRVILVIEVDLIVY